MGDHTHSAGEWMVSYRYMYMQMKGSLDGTAEVPDADVIDPAKYNFRVTPTEMPMQMHMIGLMYAPIDRVTMMAMFNVLSLSMDHLTRPGGTFTTSSSGVGDLGLTALVVLKRWEHQRLHLNAGVTLPTGSITEKDVTPATAPNETQLPYPMQLGSGTVDLVPGLTYLGQSDRWGWGGQVKGVIRLGTNDNDYALGDVAMGTAWGDRVLSKHFSVSARIEARWWDNIDGADPAYAMAVSMRMVPTVFPDLRGGRRVDAGLGANFYVPEGALRNLRIAAETLVPIYQSLDGPQLETDWTVIVGAQYSF
jgi:hypothetical protein